MDFRFSNSAASLALLIATGGCALFASQAHAGDRLEFSSPALPLAVPHPRAEVKDTKNSFGSGDASGMTSILDMVPQQDVVISRSKHKDDDIWDTNPILGEGQDKRDLDNWLEARPEPNPMTNSANGVNMPRGWDSRNPDDPFHRKDDSNFQSQNSPKLGSAIGFDAENLKNPDQYNSKFGTGIGLDGQITRDNDRFGRDSSNDRDNLSWFRTIGRDSTDKERFGGGRYTPFRDESANDTSSHDFRLGEPKPMSDPVHDMGTPSELETYTPFDTSEHRLGSEPSGMQTGTAGSLRAWEQPQTANRLPTRDSLNQSLNRSSQGVAPNRPVNLPFPKRPGDVN
jgi:hypothetical protein